MEQEKDSIENGYAALPAAWPVLIAAELPPFGNTLNRPIAPPDHSLSNHAGAEPVVRNRKAGKWSVS